MKTIIISQERDRVIECKEVGLNDTDIYATTWVDEYRKVAEYESDERANEVFKSLLQYIKYIHAESPIGTVLFEMPKE